MLAVGDAAFQQKCLGKMQDVSRGGRTVLFVSHNMAAISALCTRALVMAGGRPVFDGAAADAVRHYFETNLADSAATWDLAGVPRKMADLATLVRLDRMATTMARADGFRFCEPLRFRLEFSSQVVLESMACAIGIDDLYGARVVTFDSRREGVPISTVAGGRYAIDLDDPLVRLVARTVPAVGQRVPGGQYHDYLVHFGTISIAPLDHEDGSYVDQTPGLGPIQVPSLWQVNALEPARTA